MVCLVVGHHESSLRVLYEYANRGVKVSHNLIWVRVVVLSDNPARSTNTAMPR